MRNKNYLVLVLGSLFLFGILVPMVSAEKTWNFNNYTVNVSDDIYIGGYIYGNGSGLTDLNVSEIELSGFVPYTGATSNLVLGANNFSVDSSVLFVDSTNNNVGIGTTGPGADLEIKSKTGIATAISDARQNAGIFVDSLTGGSSWGLAIGQLTGNAQYLQTMDRAQTSTEDLLLNPYGGNVGIGTTGPSEKLHIQGSAENEIVTIRMQGLAPTDGSGYLQFDSQNDLIGLTQTLDDMTSGIIVKSDGNVGIGTTGPDNAKLHIQESATGAYGLRISNRNDNQDWGFAVDGVAIDDGKFAILDLTSGGARFIIEPTDGNVGIGTTGPQNKLNVVGTANVTSNMTIGEMTIYQDGEDMVFRV